MKKILFASTALVAFAGAAAAQDTGVTLSGSAEMGVIGGDDRDLGFHTDIDVTFTMAGETDGGLTFGASIDLDESDTDETIEGVAIDESGTSVEDIEVGGSPAFDNERQGGETIFISGAFGTLTMGDTDGAFDAALAEVPLVGTIDDVEEHAGWTGNSGLDGEYDGQIVRYDFVFGGVGLHLSGEIDDDDDNDGDPVLGIGATFGTDFAGTAVSFGLGYQTIDDLGDDDDDGAEIYGISATAALAQGFAVGVNYSKAENGDDIDIFNIGATYEFGAFTVGANYGFQDSDESGDDDGFGLGAAYDLGGGAAVQFGYASSNDEEFDDAFVNDDGSLGGIVSEDDDRYSLGFSFSF
jgi:outer membrane protein OmpU